MTTLHFPKKGVFHSTLLSSLSSGLLYDLWSSLALLSTCFSVPPAGYLVTPADINLSSPSRSRGPSADGSRSRKSGQSPSRYLPCSSSPPSLLSSAGMRSLKRPNTSQSTGTLASFHIFMIAIFRLSYLVLQVPCVRWAVMTSSPGTHHSASGADRLAEDGLTGGAWEAQLLRHHLL